MSGPDGGSGHFDLDIDLAGPGGRRWSGTVRLTPPLLGGRLVADGDAAPLTVWGQVVGLRRLADLVPGIVPDPWGWRDTTGPWARLSFVTSDGRAVVEFTGSSGYNLARQRFWVRMSPNPAEWLHARVDRARGLLAAHCPTPPTAALAWELARLRLMFDDADEATEAVRHGLALVRSSAVDRADRYDLRLLVEQLDHCRCPDAAAALQAYLDELPT